MTFGSQIARDLAADVLSDADFTEPLLWVREGTGSRNEYGEWVPGGPVETALEGVMAPVSTGSTAGGQERLSLPEGLRDEDIRTFWVPLDVQALRYGQADGDLLVPGTIGTNNPRFTGASRSVAEAARDRYAELDPHWELAYANSGDLIQLSGFGTPVYERYSMSDSGWLAVPVFRAVRPAPWGSFTEVLGVRTDPGAV